MENRYDKYKDSGIAWIGEIPEHWELRKGKNLFKLRNSKGNNNAILLAATQKYGMIPQSQVEGVVQVKQNTDLNTFKTVHKNDYVISLRSFQGGFEMSEYEGVCSPAYQVFYSTKPCCNYFFKYMFKSYGFVSQINAFTLGIREGKNIQYEDFSLMKLPLPTIQEQQSIATYLDQKCSEIDELITLQEEMITKLQSYKQSVITEAVTKGLDKNIPLKDSGIEWIGEIPEHWEVKRLKNVCSTNNASLSDKTSKDFEFDYVDIGSVSFELGIHKTEKYTFQNAPSRARKIARLGDIIVSTVRTYLRAIDIINSEEKEKYIYSTGFAILSPSKNILSEFMIYICRSEYFTNQVSIHSTGINYPSINDTALKMINIVMPPLPEQQSIATYLDQKCSEIDALISIKQQKIEKLKDYKKSLIFECVTGKRKVS